MSLTVDRPVEPTPGEPPRALARAEGLELLGEVSGSGYKEDTALVRRADGQMVQLGPLQYALLDAIDGERDLPALAAAASERLGRALQVEHVVKIAEKLAEQGLLAGTEENAPERPNPLLALRWKVLFTDPKVTGRITAPFKWLFRPWIVLPALAGFAAVLWFVLIHEGVAPATAQAFDKPELLLLILGLTVASAAFHEIGHAAACRYGGGKPGGMGAGIYVVWPAFYTDVTDAYRLPRRSRLRTDLGGIYFNAVVAVLALGVWLATGLDVLLLLIGLQMLEIVKNLSPVIRADGYHILSDATGVPDLYAHMGPTLKRLLPWKRNEPSALTGRARVWVTAWVLVIVPILLGMAFSAILLFPKLAASSWHSADHIVSAIPDQGVLGLLASVLRLFALALPVAGAAFFVVRLVRSAGSKAWGWSGGRPPRQALVLAGAAGLIAVLTWAWWPSGQYQPVRPTDDGTLVGAFRTVSAPAAVARPNGVAAAPRLAPGRHLAIALIPRGGPTKEHPALFVVNGGRDRDKPTILVSPQAPDAAKAPQFDDPGGSKGSSSSHGQASGHTHRARRPAPVQAAPRAGRGRLPGARHQHQGRRHRLRRRLLARHRLRRRAGRQRELRLRARELQRLHDARGLLPARARGRPERPDHPDQRRRGAQPQVPELHHDGDREADRDLGPVGAVGGAAEAAHRGAQEARRDRPQRLAGRRPRQGQRGVRRDQQGAGRQRDHLPEGDRDAGGDQYARRHRDA